MDAQKVFETVAKHLLRQGKASIGPNGLCAYRSSHNADDPVRCAIGCLIPDSVYVSDFELCSTVWVLVRYMNRHVLTVEGTFTENLLRAHAPMLTRLQKIHDCDSANVSEYFSRMSRAHAPAAAQFDRDRLVANLTRIAEKHGLDVEFLSAC